MKFYEQPEIVVLKINGDIVTLSGPDSGPFAGVDDLIDG